MNSGDRMTYQDRYGYYPTTSITILRCSASFLPLLPWQAMYQGLQANLAVYYAKATLGGLGGAAMADSGWHVWCYEPCILQLLHIGEDVASNRAQSVIIGDKAVTEAGRRGLERKNAPKVFLEGQELPLRQAFGHMSFKTCKVNCMSTATAVCTC